MIAIIEYGMGNTKAFANIFKNHNIEYVIAKCIGDLEFATKIVLPGVGSFDYAMQRLNESGFREKLDELVQNRKMPVIGICVGMQIMAKKSDEGSLPGLGWIDGVVKKFNQAKLTGERPLPHMGWNSLEIKMNNPLLANMDDKPRLYFLHSYYFECTNIDNVVATTNYGQEFASIIHSKNIYGIQCHPEKSHVNGVKILKNVRDL